MLRRDVAYRFAKTAAGVGNRFMRGTHRSHPASGSLAVTPGKPTRGEDRPLPRPNSAPKASDGYTVDDNAGIDPGLVPLPVTPNEASTAKFKERVLKQRIKTERGEARSR